MSNGREENIADEFVKNLLRRTRRTYSDEEIMTKAHIGLVHMELQSFLVAIATDNNLRINGRLGKDSSYMGQILTILNVGYIMLTSR